MRALTFAVAAGVMLTLAIPAPVLAGSGEPASEMLKNRKAGSSGAIPASNNWSHSAVSGGKATTLTQIVNDGSVAPFLVPDSVSLLQAAASRYEQIVASGGWPSVPGGKLRKGATGKGVAALNQRLFIEGYLRKEATEGEFAETFTSATEDALQRFQRNLGLFVTGSADSATLRELNIPASRRLAVIRANIPRIAEYSKDLGNRYVTVNVPAAQIETVGNGRVYSIHNAIVGRESRPTPVVMTALSRVRFSPYWNAPASIVEKDLIPRMLSGGASKVMNDMNMKIFQGVGGPEINPNSVNWRRAVVDDYHFRQEPGGANAMATAKIEFDSPFGIYLHDTPEPQLFDTGQRFYSSGCVRVQNVAILLNWILQGQDGIDSPRISSLAETKERLDVEIANPPQLRVVYLTAWPAKDGAVGFRPDVYNLDGAGFVLGQPLPVGETIAGQRYVLKPVPRLAQAVDADNETGFFALFGRSRNPDKESAFASQREGSDSLARPNSKSKLLAKPGAKTKFASALNKPRFGTNAEENGSPLSNWLTVKPNAAKTKAAILKKKKALAAAAKADDKKKSVKLAKAEDETATKKKSPAKKILKQDAAVTAKAEVAAKKPDTVKTQTADTCKPDKDGKLPDGCKAKPAAAKKPAVKPDKTASAN